MSNGSVYSQRAGEGHAIDGSCTAAWGAVSGTPTELGAEVRSITL